MGKMNEPVGLPELASPDFSRAQFDALATEGVYDGKAEVQLRTGLNLIRLYAGMFENGAPSNGIINVAHPWDVRVSWSLVGPLKPVICGSWCVSVHFESIGEGREFTLRHPEFKFDCNHDCFNIRIPGSGIRPEDCSTPYKAVVTVQYKTMCGRPGPIVGFVEYPVVQFYHSAY